MEFEDDATLRFKTQLLSEGGARHLLGATSLHVRVHGGASGYETDKMSARFSPPGTVRLAKGTNPDDGGAEIVYYEVERTGGSVFSVGSITYVSCLLEDPRISRITKNVIDRLLRSAGS